MYNGDTQSCLLNAGFMHELRQFREGQIIGAEKQGVSCVAVSVAVVVTLHLRMVGLLGLVQGAIGRGSIVIGGVYGGIMMVVVCVPRSRDAEQQRRRRAVHPGGCVVLVGGFVRQIALAGVQRGVCRVFVNVCEVRQWSGPGVAA